ncbi:hypothetical protein [Variovorax soli]|uniref:Uncharacterized protein n=1 Tax=Variovorax soli TaxID=376815 RepID=A0ABU1NLZ2_9BURK|nr:hypothetical protein [Variovorax soli]MDR6539478.1 hypothetical protein [Variovorax soli]
MLDDFRHHGVLTHKARGVELQGADFQPGKYMDPVTTARQVREGNAQRLGGEGGQLEALV